MKILFVCHRFPYPPNRGGKIRPFNIIKHLSRSHQVTVASLARSAEEAEAGRGLAPFCHAYLMETVTPRQALAQMLLGAPTPRPASMAHFYSPLLARRVRREVATRDFDFIFVHCSSAAQYVEDIKGIPKILDFGDMDSQKWRDYAAFSRAPKSTVYWLEGVKMRRAEKRLAGKFDLLTCTTRAELETLRGLGIDTPSDWFPNGVDLDYFAPGAEDRDPGSIVFVGRMDYFPNQQAVTHFCTAILPRIQAARPEATFTIVGTNPSKAIRALSARPGVSVTGAVPDVRPYARRAAVAVAPLKIARGTQNKMLESLAMGVPVVASPVAAGGIDAVPGEHFLVADGAEEFAAKTLRLMTQARTRRQYAEAGRARMESHHAWAGSMRRLDRIIEVCLSQAGAGSAQPDFVRT